MVKLVDKTKIIDIMKFMYIDTFKNLIEEKAKELSVSIESKKK